MSANNRLRCIVAGALGSKRGKGGHAWTRMTYALGLRRLGFDVLYVEQLTDASEQDHAYFTSVCSEFDVRGCLFSNSPPGWLVEQAHDAQLLVNIGGHLTVNELKSARVRIYVDDDPGYTQYWHAQGLIEDRLAGHDSYFTYALNIDGPGSLLPRGDIRWLVTRPPVLLEHWPRVIGASRDFTTVGSWRGPYGRIEAAGRLFGQKAHQFRTFVDLPDRVAHRFEIALDIDSSDGQDKALLQQHGWQLLDPVAAVGAPNDFRQFVQDSRAEFSVAQGIYVETGSGWFSDRTTCYLSSGKPTLVQDCGWSGHLPLGEGLVPFSTIEEAVGGAEEIDRDYAFHSKSARAIAEEHFDSDKVLSRLLDLAGV